MRIGLFELSKGVIRGYSFNQCVKYKHFQSLSIPSLVNLNLEFSFILYDYTNSLCFKVVRYFKTML